MSPRSVGWGILVQVALAAAGAGPIQAQPQSPPSDARLVGFTVEPLAAEFGEVFDLRLTLRLAPGVVAFLPDTLVPGPASVSAGPGGWSEVAGPADSLDILATYPVMGFLNGRVELPSVEVWTRAPADGESSGPRSLRDLGDVGPAAAEGLGRILISTGAVQITPLTEMAESSEGLFPRPPADVLGGQWSIWILSAVALTILTGGFLAWLLLSRWREARTRDDVTLIRASPRDEALKALDRILGLGWLGEDRLVEFYEASTGVLRRFSEQFKSEWGIALTSTELLARLRDRWGLSSVEDLKEAISVAEWVKFGRYRPETDVPEKHWRMIRDWIARMPES